MKPLNFGTPVFSTGRGFWPTAFGHVEANPAGQLFATRLAHRIYGAGYNNGAAPAVSDGTQKTFDNTYVNDSGAEITVCSAAFQGWVLRTTGTVDVSAAYPVSGNIECPVGTIIGSFTATVIPGEHSGSLPVTLTAAIPKGASFRITGSASPANGATYVTQSLGFAGLRTHALLAKLCKVALGVFGDSLATNNGGAAYNAALGRCPAYLNSIIGTTAKTYAENNGQHFRKQVALCNFLGLTDVITNFAHNDTPVSILAELIGHVTVMRDMVRGVGLKYNHVTMGPRCVQKAAVAISSLVSSGKFATATVADASLFDVGMPIVIAGAAQTEYNGANLIVTAVDALANTITYLFPGSATTPATGSPTARSWKPSSSAKWMEPVNSKYAAGPDSYKGMFNAWVRSGALDGYIDLADATEPFRDAGRWLVAGESPLLSPVQTITVSNLINASRFNSNYSAGSSTIPNGFVQFSSGQNQGVARSGNGNTNGDITVSSAFPNALAVGDQARAVPGTFYMSDDLLHLRQGSGGKGGQAHFDNAMAKWIDMKNAA